MAVPLPIAVTTPVGLTEATATDEVLQVPPGIVLLTIAVPPRHKPAGPLNAPVAGDVLTVIVNVLTDMPQPALRL